jgi:AI-2 transport protein TqsA
MNKSQTNIFVVIASVIIIIAGFMSAQTVVLPIILALFISVIFAQPILWMEKRKVPYWLGMIIVLVGAGLLFVLFGGIIGNSLRRFTQDAPKYEERLRNIAGSTITELNNLGANINKDQLFDFLDLDQISSVHSHSHWGDRQNHVRFFDHHADHHFYVAGGQELFIER